MSDYSDCVLKRCKIRNGRESLSCFGLRQMLCTDGVKCPFYASSKEYYRDKKTGFVKKKGEKDDEKIHIRLR